MRTRLYPSQQRGFADYGWLKSYHSFSFAHFYDPQLMNFGVLRVLNDDFVEAGMGFSTHPHANMEIISIPLQGELEHRDSMGNVSVIRSGDIQIMSAGSGVTHSEYNHSKSTAVKFLQIWVFPNVNNTEPSYDQISPDPESYKNNFALIVSPAHESVGINIKQNAWFHLGEFEASQEIDYHYKSEGTGLYIFVLSGNIQVAGQELNNRDAIGIWETDTVSMHFSEKSKVLLMEVPMDK